MLMLFHIRGDSLLKSELNLKMQEASVHLDLPINILIIPAVIEQEPGILGHFASDLKHTLVTLVTLFLHNEVPG